MQLASANDVGPLKPSYRDGDFSHLVNVHGWRDAAAQEYIAAGLDAEHHNADHLPNKEWLHVHAHSHKTPNDSFYFSGVAS